MLFHFCSPLPDDDDDRRRQLSKLVYVVLRIWSKRHSITYCVHTQFAAVYTTCAHTHTHAHAQAVCNRRRSQNSSACVRNRRPQLGRANAFPRRRRFTGTGAPHNGSQNARRTRARTRSINRIASEYHHRSDHECTGTVNGRVNTNANAKYMLTIGLRNARRWSDKRNSHSTAQHSTQLLQLLSRIRRRARARYTR